MRQTDCLSASFLPPVILLVVSLLLALPVAVSAYQPQPSISGVNFDNASLNLHVLVKRDGYVTADASFHMEKKVQGPPTSFAHIPFESGDLHVRAEQVGDNLVKLNADVQATLVEDKLGTKTKFGLSYLSNMAVEDVNGKYAPMIENLYSKLGGMIKAQAQTAQETSGNNQNVLKNVRLPKLREFKITSFTWNSPRLNVSVTAELAHRGFESLDLPMGLDASVDVGEKSIESNANFSATTEGPGLENAGFGLSVSQEDNLALLDASASVEGRMPNKDNLYVVDLSHYMKGVGRKRFQKLENVEFPEGFHVTFQLEVSEGLSVENQPSAPSYCKTEKRRTYVWENQDAVTAVASLLSGESNFVVKSVPEKKSQTAFPYVYVAIGIVVAVATTSVAYWKRKGSQEGEK